MALQYEFFRRCNQVRYRYCGPWVRGKPQFTIHCPLLDLYERFIYIFGAQTESTIQNVAMKMPEIQTLAKKPAHSAIYQMTFDKLYSLSLYILLFRYP